MKTIDMPLDRAKEITGRLVDAFLALDMGYRASTKLSDITMADAVAAVDIMRAYPGEKHADGSKTLYVVPDDSCIPKLAHLLAQSSI